jgi:hypothetical protein
MKGATGSQTKPAADLARKPERSVSMATVEEHLIELRENAQPK